MNEKDEIIRFWFEELTPAQWWVQDEEVDKKIREQFSALQEKAAQGQLAQWRGSPRGALAEILVLDQFSRNIFRGNKKAFASDKLARNCTLLAIEAGFDQQLKPQQRAFIYLPLMHSEDASDHEKALTLFAQEGLEANLEAEIKHKAIVDRFGRYPHRNEVLGRESTEEELEFLKQPGSSF